jgi:aryl-alcohol dehydrogenase-like predicted oxidoreductase
MEIRNLGSSGLRVSLVGLGCNNFGARLDVEATRKVVHKALDLGITLFDTADVYGTGHSERILGEVLGAHRDEVVIATKWGNTIDESTRQLTGQDASPEYLRTALDASLRRLGTDYIDLYQLHLNDLPIPQAEDLIATLEGVVDAGKIRWYGWSTDFADRAAAWARGGEHCVAIQHAFSVLQDAGELLAVCEANNLASLNRSPLAMGLLTGKFTASSTLGPDDVRGVAPGWLKYFDGGRPVPIWLERVAAVRDVLRSGGRTLGQGALAWIWARSDVTVPIPGCRTVAQVEENAGAMEHGPLEPDELAEVERLLAELREEPVAAM